MLGRSRYKQSDHPTNAANPTEAGADDYTAALKIVPRMAMALYGRGRAKWKKGDPNAAALDFAAAHEIDRNIAEEFARLGVQ